MNIRGIYISVIVLLSMGLLYEWNLEQRSKVISDHLRVAEASKLGLGEGLVQIENDKLSVVVNVNTGAIIETRLKEHPVENVTGSLGFRVFGYSNSSSFSYYFKSGFTGATSNYSLLNKDDSFIKLVDKESGHEKTISFLPETYELSVEDFNPNGVIGKPYAGLYRTGGRALDLKTNWLDGGAMNNSSYEGVAISTENEAYESIRLRSVDKPQETLSRSGWIAFVQKYFFAALLGSEDYIYNYYVLPENSGVYRMGYTVESSADGGMVYGHKHRLFVGPKVRKDLMQRSDNLELAIDMGWFWFLSQPMVSFMDWLNGYLNSWGLTIVVFTLLIKFVFWPVTAKSFRSMAALRKITPELNEIKERYKNDRQQQSQETMKLMREKGANPLGGCLPMVLQIPFFIGFFFALREMVELRHTPLGFWADLSAPDPYFIMPVLFGLIMLMTQRLNPQPVGMDPTQAQVMKFMPIMFSVMFVFFPAGLCLYTVVNSGVQLIQQYLLYRKHGAAGGTYTPSM